MVSIHELEDKISNFEGFRIIVGINDEYNYSKKAKNDSTVEEWKNSRFKKAFPGLDVQVLDKDGSIVHGNTKLSSLRQH